VPAATGLSGFVCLRVLVKGFVESGLRRGARPRRARAGLARCRWQQLFNTIGNPAMDPRVGVFFVDFATGSLLQLTGGRDRLGAGSGAQRLMTVLVEAISELREPLPLRWSAPA
jgi:hypothetical protein